MTGEDFKKEVFPLKNKIFRFAKRLMNIHAEAEDITQDVFVKLWNKKQDLLLMNSIEAYAMTVTKNLCLDKLKARKAIIVEMPVYELPLQTADPNDQAEITNQRKLMNTIINSLPEQQKMIIQLREIEGYEFEEIATITDMNINAVRVALSRARKAIKEELVKMYNYGLKAN